MGAKSREEIQDIALSRMDKVARHSKGERDARPMKPEDQMREQKRVEGLSPRERVKEMSGSDWSRGLKEYLDSKEVRLRHGSFSQRFLTWLFNRKKVELGEWKAKGAPYSEMVTWLRDLSDEFINL